MTTDNSSMEKEVKALKRLGWSQDDMARLLDVTRPTIKKMLTGEKTKLSKVSAKILTVISRQGMTIEEMRSEALKEYVARHYLKEAYLELAREIDELLDDDTRQGEDT